MGTVLYPEGSTRGLTIDEASAVADGPGWWLRFEEVPDRNAADVLRGVYLEIEPPDEPREPGRWFWHELEGLAVRGSDGTELGRVTDIYRAGGAEVFVVRGPRGELDVPGVQGIVLELAPDRGEMIVDMDALALDARPVDDEDYVRPRDRRPPNPKRPKTPKPGRATGEGVAAEGARRAGGARRAARSKDSGTRTLSADEIATLRGTPAARPRPPATRSRRPTPADARDRGPDPVPADGRGPAAGEHPGSDPGSRPRQRPRPRPPRVGAGPPPHRGRLHVRRGSGHGPAPGARGRGTGGAPAAGLDRDPPRSRGRGVPPVRSPTSSPARRTSCSCARATRAWTSGSGPWWTASSRSATTCSRAASSGRS